MDNDSVVYRCARCGYQSHNPAQFEIKGTEPYRECNDRQRCNQAVIAFALVRESVGR